MVPENHVRLNGGFKRHGAIFYRTQFQIEGEGLVQGITKLITILFTFVTLNKTMPIELTKNGVDSSFLGSKCFFKIRCKTIKHPYEEPFFSLFLQKIKVKVLQH